MVKPPTSAWRHHHSPGRWVAALRPPQPKKMPRPVSSTEVATAKWSPPAPPKGLHRSRSSSPKKLVVRPTSKAQPRPAAPSVRAPPAIHPAEKLRLATASNETSTGIRPQPPPMHLYQESKWGSSECEQFQHVFEDSGFIEAMQVIQTRLGDVLKAAGQSNGPVRVNVHVDLGGNGGYGGSPWDLPETIAARSQTLVADLGAKEQIVDASDIRFCQRSMKRRFQVPGRPGTCACDPCQQWQLDLDGE
eukprot:Skav221489  [mRNA]  locus=scaffold5554:28472:37066:- [translate_table: standard]